MSDTACILLLRFLLGHFFADFVLQTNACVRERQNNSRNHLKIISKHSLVVAAMVTISAVGLLKASQMILIFLVVLSSHFVIDILKDKMQNNDKEDDKQCNCFIFLIDQLLHLSVLVFLILFLFATWSELLKMLVILIMNKEYLFYILAYLVLAHPSACLVGEFTKKWRSRVGDEPQNELKVDFWSGISAVGDESPSGLQNAGFCIGILERWFILTFILCQSYQGIGFLIAAKSVFRFGNLDKSKHVRRTEYILIGTLFSAFLAFIVGLLVVKISPLLRLK